MLTVNVPEGEAGELFVGGECLARGYVELPEKTEESFPEDPFSSKNGAKMYRSGDRARILSDGSLEILGRVDFMVKIRGYSVELGAVEAAIEEGLAVKSCVVVSEGEEGEDKRLVAYIVPDPEDDERYSGWGLDPKTGRSKEIRGVLQDSLPHYAVPSVFVELEALPIQATSGKVDRSELPPPPPRPARRDTGDSARLPETASRPEKEALLVGAWEDVLRLDKGEVGPEDTSSISADTRSPPRSSPAASSRASASTSPCRCSWRTRRREGCSTGSRCRRRDGRRSGDRRGPHSRGRTRTRDSSAARRGKHADPAGRRRRLPYRGDRISGGLPARRATLFDKRPRPLPRQAPWGRSWHAVHRDQPAALRIVAAGMWRSAQLPSPETWGNRCSV